MKTHDFLGLQLTMRAIHALTFVLQDPLLEMKYNGAEKEQLAKKLAKKLTLEKLRKTPWCGKETMGEIHAALTAAGAAPAFVWPPPKKYPAWVVTVCPQCGHKHYQTTPALHAPSVRLR